MANEKEYIVTLKKGVDKQEFDTFMRSQYGNETVPARSVDVANSRIGSSRLVHYYLDDQEAAQLKNNPSVINVETPIEDDPNIIITPYGSQTALFYRGSTTVNTHVNWGLKRSSITEQTTSAYNTGNTTYEYPLNGTGVDVVIQDSGIQPDHPEWQDADGNSRMALIDWATESGLPFTQSANHYRDRDGHGTHVAGIVAGKTYGWAKGAHIYSQKLLGLETLQGTDGTGISTTYAFDAIRLWHNAKTNGRPTVVNMSWGTRKLVYGDPISGTYRGSPWTFTTQSDFALWQSYGIVPKFNNPGGDNYRVFPAISSYIDAEVEDMIDAGIHVCLAAGNDYYKQDVSNGADYDNSLTIYSDVGNTTQTTETYHRGGSPYSDKAFMVGNISSAVSNNLDRPVASSRRGPAVNIWAPGTDIMSTTSNEYDTDAYTAYDYPEDSNFKVMKIGGTSMAAPQVAGFVACYLQMNPNVTTEETLNKVIDLSAAEIDNSSDTAYEDSDALLGSPNRVLISPFQAQPITTTGAFSIANAGYEFDTSADDSVPDPAPQGQTLTIGVTNAGAGSYTLSGDVTGSNATVNCNAGDTLLFNVSASGHPFYIKTSPTTGTGNQAAGVTNNGSQSGQVSWTPTTPGTYYYICQFHSGMQGQIVVS